MLNIIHSDIYRMRKSKLFYGVTVLAGFIAFLLMMLNRQDIRLGISIFGNLTTFISVEDVVRLGIEYQKGLGIIVAVFISVFIGREYQWNTWQHKWLISKSRSGMYMSKVLLSVLTSAMIFLLFEIIVLVCSGQINYLLAGDYVVTVLCGCAIYAALGAVLCLLSMLIKSNVASIVVSMGYVLFSETLVTIIQNISNISATASKIAEWCYQHSIYGMSSILCNVAITTSLITSIVLTSLAIVIISVLIGMVFFRKYEL